MFSNKRKKNKKHGLMEENVSANDFIDIDDDHVDIELT